MFEYRLTVVWRDGSSKLYTRNNREELQRLWAQYWTELITYGQIAKINKAANGLVVEVECTSGPTKRENFQ